jgi:type IV pilus assembly protein PilQ
VGEAEVLTEVQLKMKDPISVDFNETPIEDVLRILAKQADVDIVKSPLVIGNVTATLSEIPLEEALDNILAAHGYGYIATDNMIRIVPRKDIYDIPEKMVNRVYRITYADVKELETALAKFISSRGSISSMPGTSNIIVTDAESKIEAIDKFVEQVDRVTQQVLVEVRIYDVTDTESFNLDIQWNAHRQTVDADGALIAPRTGGDMLSPDVVNTRGEDVGDIAYPVKRADPFATGSFDRKKGGALRVGFLNDSISLDLLLTTLHTKGYAILLANPSIMVLDNEEAMFKIVKEIPYKEESSTSNGGQLTSTQFKDVGVELAVTPHITRDNMLRLQVEPEFGVAEEQQRNPITNEALVPTVNTRKLKTVALLMSGQTVVLGGLRKQEVTKDNWKTPILGDLPIIGGLFKSESETVETTELLVFITPKILDQGVMTNHDTQLYKYTDIPSVNYPKLRGEQSK